MKNAILAVFFLIPFSLAAQQKIKLPERNGNIFYEEIASLDSIKKESLYQRAKFWMVNSFRDSRNVLETDNMQLGQLTGKGSISTGFAPPFFGSCVIDFIININVKDGRYRCQLYDFVCRPLDPTELHATKFNFKEIYTKYQNGDGITYWRFDSKKKKMQRAYQLVDEFNNTIKALMGSLKAQMKSDNNSNW